MGGIGKEIYPIILVLSHMFWYLKQKLLSDKSSRQIPAGHMALIPMQTAASPGGNHSEPLFTRVS
jgi:hypothetical protein